ncbi:hypothetical protein [Undibacter mobilis]|uniref:hypothetical protein n=1 Tax=Undibacter mobilis TaxID=2292256 RepID=UPI00143CC9BE|nr:hypothetical protein [Undibacter mobilis]
MTIPTNYAVENRMEIDRVVRQAQAARAEAIQAAAHDLAVGIKRFFAALRPQAAH